MVQVYTIEGPQEQLPSLLQSRNGHACAYFLDSQDRVVSIAIDMNNIKIKIMPHLHKSQFTMYAAPCTIMIIMIVDNTDDIVYYNTGSLGYRGLHLPYGQQLPSLELWLCSGQH